MAVIILRRGETFPEEARELLRWVKRTDAAAFDIETVGLDPAEGRLRFAQIGDSEQQFICHEEHRAVFATALREVPTILAHNGLFDAIWLQRVWGIAMESTVERMVDTMTLARLYDPRRAGSPSEDDGIEKPWSTSSGLGLKELAHRFLGSDSDLEERALYSKFELPRNAGKIWTDRWSRIPDSDPALIAYAAADVRLTTELFRFLVPMMERHEIEELLPVEQRGSATAFGIMVRGLHVDLDAANAMRDGLRNIYEGYLPELREHGIHKIGSPTQIVTALRNEGAPLTKTTASGKSFSVDKSVLDGLAETHPLAATIRDAKRSKKYAADYAGKLADSSGLIHPSVNTNSTVTGRWSLSNPPVQQWPATSWQGQDLRSLFVAPPGQMLVSADLSSIELVVGAAVSNDPNMLAAVGVNTDEPIRVYDDLASQLGVERKQAKTLVLAGMYGAGVGKLAVALGTDDLGSVSKLKAETFGGYWCSDCTRSNHYNCERKTWDDGYYSNIRSFRRNLQEVWEADGWDGETREGWPGLRSPYGRWVPAAVGGDGSPMWFPIFNHVVQGAARDLLMRQVIEAEDRGLSIWLTVHDEIVSTVDEADAEEARRILINVMTTEKDSIIGLPIRCESTEPSKSWGSK